MFDQSAVVEPIPSELFTYTESINMFTGYASDFSQFAGDGKSLAIRSAKTGRAALFNKSYPVLSSTKGKGIDGSHYYITGYADGEPIEIMNKNLRVLVFTQ